MRRREDASFSRSLIPFHSFVALQISINASCSLEEMVEVRKPGQPLLFQIYLDKNRKNSEDLVKKVEEVVFDGIFFTIG